MQMKLLACGEGPHDVGSREWDEKSREWRDLEGWLQPIIRKILGPEVMITSLTRKDIILFPRQINRYRPLPKGHGAKALAASIFAKINGYTLVVYMADNDSPEKKEWSAAVQSIEAGFQAFDPAHRNVACVPMSASECWILSDGAAWELAFNAKPETSLRPETLWGERHDPEGNHPKHVFARACAELNVPDNAKTRNYVAEHISIETLSKTCPISFPPFKKSLNR